MLQTKFIDQIKIKNNSYLFINFVFAFFPISFILGSLFVNLNLLLFCCLGIFYLKSKILTTKFDFSIKIILLFFLIIIFSTGLSFIKSLYFGEYNYLNLERLIKSILFFRYFILLVTIYLLNKFSILNFKYFFISAALSSLILSIDIIYQYTFGFDVIGLKSDGFYNSGFFGDEYIAGSFIQRFGFFAILFTILIFKNKNYTKFISTVIVICTLGVGIFLCGNRMPSILFLFGLILVLLFNLKIKKILFVSIITLAIILKFIISSNEAYNNFLVNAYGSFLINVKNMTVMPSRFGIPTWSKSYLKSVGKTRNINYEELLDAELETKKESLGDKLYFYDGNPNNMHKRLFSTAIYTWRTNKIFGNGIKSFREDCRNLSIATISLEEDLYRECSNHPHNYYFEVLTETGIVGLVTILTIGSLFIVFIFKNFTFLKEINIENLILLSAIISLILETLPFRSTGSLFTTNNSTYLILIASIVLSQKTFIRVNNSR